MDNIALINIIFDSKIMIAKYGIFDKTECFVPVRPPFIWKDYNLIFFRKVKLD